MMILSQAFLFPPPSCQDQIKFHGLLIGLCRYVRLGSDKTSTFLLTIQVSLDTGIYVVPMFREKEFR